MTQNLPSSLTVERDERVTGISEEEAFSRWEVITRKNREKIMHLLSFSHIHQDSRGHKTELFEKLLTVLTF